MGFQTMGSHGDGIGDNFKLSQSQSQFQTLPRRNSIYNLTFDEVQNQLGNLGKPVCNMNLDELLRNVWTAEAHQNIDIDIENNAALGLSKKTVDEVWRDIQQGKNDIEARTQERQLTLGEMTLEDFLVKAGIVAEGPLDRKNGGGVSNTTDQNAMSTFPHSCQWLQYPQPQFQHPQQNIMGAYMSIPQPLPMDVQYGENQLNLSSPMMGALSETQQTSVRKRAPPEELVERSVERRQKRMIKNRESAARSRARKQAYTNELESKVSLLEEENDRLRKQKELQKMIPATVPVSSREPKYQLRRTSSAHL